MIVSKTNTPDTHTHTCNTHSTHIETLTSTEENLKIENKKNHIKNF